MPDLLIRGRHVICGIGDDARTEQIDDGAVLVRGDRIAAVGPAAALARQAQDAEVIGGPDSIVFPGFVNAHHHVGLTPFQLGSPDLPLELWFGDRIGNRSVDLYLDTLYSAFELVRSGVTAVQHLQVRYPGGREAVAGAAHEIIRAYRQVGLRVSYSYGLRDQNVLAYEPDADFLARLPDDLAAELGPFLASFLMPLDDHVSLFDELSAAYADDPLVAIQLAPVNLHWCSDEALERMADLSQRRSVPLHMHLLETPYQKVYARRRTGASAVAYLERKGLLGPLMTLGHGVWMTGEDLDAIAATDTRICHNCSSNMRLKSGTAPVNAMLARNIKVAIGIDEANINDDRDMLQEMRLVLRAHRPPGFDAAEPSAADVFRMATEHGAQTTPFAGQTGRITEGQLADLVIVNWPSLAEPFLDPRVAPLDALVNRARSGSVETVLIGGEVVFRDGRFANVDEQSALAELRDRMARPPDEAERRRRDMAHRVMPYVRAVYDDYLKDETWEPFDRRNSRL